MSHSTFSQGKETFNLKNAYVIQVISISKAGRHDIISIRKTGEYFAQSESIQRRDLNFRISAACKSRPERCKE